MGARVIQRFTAQVDSDIGRGRQTDYLGGKAINCPLGEKAIGHVRICPSSPARCPSQPWSARGGSAAAARAVAPVGQVGDELVAARIHAGSEIAPDRLFHPPAHGRFQIRPIAFIYPRPELKDARLEREAADGVDLAIAGGPPRPATHLAPANLIARRPAPQPLADDGDILRDGGRARRRARLARREQQ
jgi:hypothetical protein